MESACELSILKDGEAFAVPLTRQFVVGSSHDAHLVVEATGVAPTHFVINPSARGAVLLVLGSGEPVTVNQLPISGSRRLGHGDCLGLSGITLTYWHPAIKDDTRPLEGLLAHFRGTQTSRSLKDSQRFNLLQGESELNRTVRTLYRLSALGSSSASETELYLGALELLVKGCLASQGVLVRRGVDQRLYVTSAYPKHLGLPKLPDQLPQTLDRASTSTGTIEHQPFACVPVVQPGAGRAEAAVFLSRPHSASPFTHSEVELLATLGRQLGAAVERVRLLKRLRQNDLAAGSIRRRFEAVMEAISEGLVLVSKDLTFDHLSRRSRQLLERAVGSSAPSEERSLPHDSPLAQLVLDCFQGKLVADRELVRATQVIRLSVTPIPALNRVALVLSDVTEQRVKEAELRRVQRRLEAEVLEISEKEQRRIGQELHDGLAQQLFGISLLSKSLEDDLAAADRPELEQATEVGKLLKATTEHARALAKRHSPVPIDEAGGLPLALEDMVRTFRRLQSVVELSFEDTGQCPHLEPNVAAHLFHIVREATSNALKHAQAQRISIQLTTLPSEVQLTIEDDGVGFTHDLDLSAGLGLSLMRSRARTIGGRLSLRQLERGTRVTCALPRRGQPQ